MRKVKYIYPAANRSRLFLAHHKYPQLSTADDICISDGTIIRESEESCVLKSETGDG